MKLMYAPQSPFSRKVRAAAIELGLADRMELEYAEVVPSRKNAEYGKSINPLRKVPALILDDGKTVLIDSTVICEFLDSLAGGGRLIPVSGPDRWRVLSQHAVAQGMCEAVILVRYELSIRPQTMRWPDWLDDQWDKIWSGLEWFESCAERVLQNIAIDLSQLTLASCLGYVDFRYPETNWAVRFPRVAAWYDGALSRLSLANTMPRTRRRPKPSSHCCVPITMQPSPSPRSNSDVSFRSAQCPLLAQSGHADPLNQCPLSGVKRTLR